MVYDFRSADMAEGGGGAAVPRLPRRPADRHGVGPETAVLNLGGIGNITWRSSTGELVGFDTGPANAPIDDWIGVTMPDSGNPGRSCRSCSNIPISNPHPQIAGQADFASSMADGMSLEDGAALLIAAAGAVAKAVSLPEPISNLILCGGGRHNPALVEAIASQARVQVTMADDLGWRGVRLKPNVCLPGGTASCRSARQFPGNDRCSGTVDRRPHCRAVALLSWTGKENPMTRQNRTPDGLLDPDAIDMLVVHCSDTPDDQPVGARDIQEMHLGFGWDGIGYHQVICRDGTRAGRPEYWRGAHARGE